MTLGEIVKQFREEQDMSQRKFAELSGLSNSYISQLEANMNSKNGQPIKPSLEAINSVAVVMGCTLDEVLRMMGDEKVDFSTSAIQDDQIDTQIMRLVRQLPHEKKLSLLDLLQATVAGARK